MYHRWCSDTTAFYRSLKEKCVMQKRGRILRDPLSGPGLLMVEGQQYPFSLEGIWRSEAPPTTGMIVDVEFDASSRVTAVSAVAEAGGCG